MKFIVQLLRIFAICGLLGSWLQNYTEKHQMPITRTATGFVDKSGNPCSEEDYRRGRRNVGVFLACLIVVIGASVALPRLKKPNEDEAPENKA